MTGNGRFRQRNGLSVNRTEHDLTDSNYNFMKEVSGQTETEVIHKAGNEQYYLTTSEMIHHHEASLSKQQTPDLLLCHSTQLDLSLSTV